MPDVHKASLIKCGTISMVYIGILAKLDMLCSDLNLIAYVIPLCQLTCIH